MNFAALRNPRADMAWVAIAGPAINIVLAILAALAFHLVGLAPADATQFDNLKNALVINAILAVFNMFPLAATRRRTHRGQHLARYCCASARAA